VVLPRSARVNDHRFATLRDYDSVCTDDNDYTETKMHKKKNGLPQVKVEVSPSGRLLRFKCPHCKTIHVHGTGGDAAKPLLGHRAADQCHPGSPFRATGYEVVLG